MQNSQLLRMISIMALWRACDTRMLLRTSLLLNFSQCVSARVIHFRTIQLLIWSADSSSCSWILSIQSQNCCYWVVLPKDAVEQHHGTPANRQLSHSDTGGQSHHLEIWRTGQRYSSGCLIGRIALDSSLVATITTVNTTISCCGC